jgi:hypothetical protein
MHAIHAQFRTELIMIEYAQQAIVVARSIRMSSQSFLLVVAQPSRYPDDVVIRDILWN